MSAPIYPDYLTSVGNLLGAIAAEASSIDAAAIAIADRVAADRLIFVFGPGGHSMIGAQEVFFRAGGLGCVNAILDEGYSLEHGARRSMEVERTPGYARAVLKPYGLAEGDLLLIVNAYGVNAGCVDSAVFAREVGATTVGVTSVSLQKALAADHPARHPSGQNLCDLVDIVVDSKVPLGDAVVNISGVPEPVGAVSTFANAFAMNAIMLEAVAELGRRGIELPLWRSANSPGGDAANRHIVEKYQRRVPKL